MVGFPQTLFGSSDIGRPQATDPPKMSMDPSVRVTMARLVSLRLPVPKRVRLVLPGRLIVFTEETLTSKIFSTAILISVLSAEERRVEKESGYGARRELTRDVRGAHASGRVETEGGA